MFFLRSYIFQFFLRCSLVFALMCLSDTARASFLMTNHLRNAHAQLLELRLAEARQSVAAERLKNPDNALCDYFDNYADMAILLINENEDLYDQLSDNEDLRLDRLAEQDKNSPYYQFVRAEIKMQWAFVRLKFGHEISAAWSLRQAYKLLAANAEKHPTFIPQLKSLGMMQMLIGSVPEKYMWILNAAGLSANLHTGLSNLQKATQQPNEFGKEAQLLLALAQVYMLKQPQQATQLLGTLHQKDADNPLVCFLYGNVLMKENRSEIALQVLLKYPKGSQYAKLFMVSYLIGEIYLQKAEYARALVYFNYFLENHTGKNYKKDARYKMFLCYWLNNDSTQAQLHFAKIKNEGRALLEADQYAQRVANSQTFPNAAIMRVRLFTDGGYFAQASEALQSIKIQMLTGKDQTEYFYRAARLYHLTKQTELAIAQYKKTIEMGKTLPHYFAANSALQLGYLYKAQLQAKEACFYFKMALSFREHEYKNSIDNKAKAALVDCE
jgi:hypothetical protein